jgi:hypothetical protein
MHASAAPATKPDHGMACMVDRPDVCCYIYKYQSDSIYLRTGVYIADLSM